MDWQGKRIKPEPNMPTRITTPNVTRQNGTVPASSLREARRRPISYSTNKKQTNLPTDSLA